jgi:hypothetical protein
LAFARLVTANARRSGGCAPLPLPERRAPLGIPCAVEAMATLPDDRGVRRRRIGGCRLGEAEVNTFRLLFVGATFLILPVEAQEHRFEDDPIMTCARTSSRVTCSLNCSASWRTHASCSPENVCRCAQEIVFASTRNVARMPASIRTRGFLPANGRTRRPYRNERDPLWPTSGKTGLLLFQRLSSPPRFALQPRSKANPDGVAE